MNKDRSCKGNKIYIKPQLIVNGKTLCLSCKGNKIYIKPQQRDGRDYRFGSCKGNKIYIKPQQKVLRSVVKAVVKVIKSISNHNPLFRQKIRHSL